MLKDETRVYMMGAQVIGTGEQLSDPREIVGAKKARQAAIDWMRSRDDLFRVTVCDVETGAVLTCVTFDGSTA